MKDSAIIETNGSSLNPNPSYPSKAWTITYSSDARALLPTISKDIHPEVQAATSDLGKSIRDLRPSSRVEAGVVARNIHLRTEKILSKLGKYTPASLVVALIFSFVSMTTLSFLDPKLPGKLVATLFYVPVEVSNQGGALVKVGAGVFLKGLASDLRISASVIDGVAGKVASGVTSEDESVGFSGAESSIELSLENQDAVEDGTGSVVDRVALMGEVVSLLVSDMRSVYQSVVVDLVESGSSLQ